MWRDGDAPSGFAHGLIGRWRPAHQPHGAAALLPTLRAYGGLRVADACGEAHEEPLGRLGPLEIRLARKAKDVRLAQKLRYSVFYKEMSAIADARTRLARRDVDAFDAICEHLLVLDDTVAARGRRRKPRVVGTYRLLRQEVAERHGGFYSAGEFAVEGLVARHPSLRFLELGRSCVLAPYRNKRTVELLWHGIWAYVLEHRIDVMFGCASLDGTDPAKLAHELSYLHHFHAAPESWTARAVPHKRIGMDLLPRHMVDAKAAWRALPPLVKGYLRLGAIVGADAVVDYQFGTTDVLIVLPVAGISGRYIQHFGPAAERHAA
jgi:putative hemolysin